jgi:biotin-dependent carboxylase-like uncharacterized protein
MNNSFFKVLRPGINSTYQDKGRFGLQHFGIAAGGCMDSESFLLANAILGNKETEGMIEFAYQGPLLKMSKGKTKLVIAGNVIFKITYSDKRTVEGQAYKSYNLEEGDEIDILATKESVYGYLSVKGGFDIKPFCNSVSTLVKGEIGPNDGKKISNGDTILIKNYDEDRKNFFIDHISSSSNIIRILKGPQYEYFSKESKKNFLSQSYNVTNLTDRMGMRLEGPVLKNVISSNIRSEGITKGAIQVPADGQPIILLTDHPTIGGYPKIANVASVDYDLLVQKKPRTSILFKCIELKEAEQLYNEKQNKISKIIKNIKEIN